jgi:hypothetical protein
MEGLGNRRDFGAPGHCLFECGEDFEPFLTGKADSQVALEDTLFLWS